MFNTKKQMIDSFKAKLSQKKRRVKIRTEFSPGDQVVGIFERIEPQPTPACTTDLLVISDENDQEIGVWLSDYVRTAMERQAAQPGHLVSILCFDEYVSESGKTYPSFKVDFDDPANHQSHF